MPVRLPTPSGLLALPCLAQLLDLVQAGQPELAALQEPLLLLISQVCLYVSYHLSGRFLLLYFQAILIAQCACAIKYLV